VSLTAADVAEIMRLVEQSHFDEVTLEVDGMKISLRRGQGAVTGAADGGPQTAGATAAAAPATGVAASSSRAGGGPTQASLGGAQLGTAARSAALGGASANPTPAHHADAGRAPPQSADPNIKDVTSPLLGTFYRAPKPGAPSFVEVGSRVEEDTVVAIIEVMKLMNSVRAGVRGTVTEILPGDGTLVEYGETLLRVKAG